MALNPLGLAPLVIVAGILGLVLLSSASETVERRLTRIARRLFGRYVRESQERERQLEAAYIGQSYRSYATRTYLYTGLAAIGGAVAGRAGKSQPQGAAAARGGEDFRPGDQGLVQ